MSGKKYEQVEPLLQQALQIWEQTQEQHPDSVESLEVLARLRDVQGRRQEALSFYQCALPIQGQILGAEHPTTLAIRTTYLALQQATNLEDMAASGERPRILPSGKFSKGSAPSEGSSG